MDRPDIPLNALRTFEVAMRQGSFTRAAIELCVSQAAVSHQIARLEDLLGVTLFLRTSGGLVPTDEGQALFPVLEHGLDAMARVLDRITGTRGTEVLKVGVVTSFAVGWLIPRLPAFQSAHPNVEIRISTNNNRVEILREGLDMAIRFGTGQWAGYTARPVLRAPLTPLCAPDVARRIERAEDLFTESLLRSYRKDEWVQWFSAVGCAPPPLTGPILDSSIALAELAQLGAGVALLPHVLFQHRLAEAQLVRPLSASVEAGQYYVTWPADRGPSPAMLDFATWLHRECAGPPA